MIKVLKERLIEILSNVNILMNIVFEELCECEKDTNILSPIVDPLTIIINIIKIGRCDNM